MSRKLKVAARVAEGLLVGLAIWTIYTNVNSYPDYSMSRTATLEKAYFVIGKKGSSYVIRHDRRKFLAKCRASLSWTNGIDKAGAPMTDGDCMYMDMTVGKSIGNDMMRHEGNTLVFSPWTGVDTVQTADFLTILQDIPNDPQHDFGD